jgi:hypothetical protein
MDFTAMQQVNHATGFKRPILRRLNPHFVDEGEHGGREIAATPALPLATCAVAPSAPVSSPARSPFDGLETPDLCSRIRCITVEELAQVIEGDVDLDAEAPVGGTLLTWAAEAHRADLVRVLLEKGANIHKRDSNSRLTALEWAMQTEAPVLGEEAPLANRAATISLLSAA